MNYTLSQLFQTFQTRGIVPVRDNYQELSYSYSFFSGKLPNKVPNGIE